VFRVSFTNALPVTATEIASETAKDPLLSKVYCYTMEGWPQQIVSEEMRPFYQQQKTISYRSRLPIVGNESNSASKATVKTSKSYILLTQGW